MGRDFLQVALTDLQTQGIQLRSIERTVFNLVTGTAQYSAASNVIDIDERTPYVSNSSNVDLPLRKISRGEYMALSNKTSQAPPSMFYVEKGATLSFFLYPTPDSQYTTVTMPCIVLQPDMTAADNTTGLPSRYLNTVILSLAIVLCDHHGLTERKNSLEGDLGIAKSAAVNDDTERGPICFRAEPGLKFRGRW